MAAHCTCCSLLLLAALSLPFFFFFFFFHSCTPAAAAAAAADQYVNNNSFLELSPGLNLSFLASFNASTGDPLSPDLMFTVGMQTPDVLGIFFPILSSPSFNSTSSSSHSRGFSLGFYADSEFDAKVYLAVCAGSSGNYSSYLNASVSSSSSDILLNVYVTNDGSVVPVWIANMDKPIGDCSKASLGVVADSSNSTNYILQLKDGDEIVWYASNVGMMEMRDNGDLLIFNDTSPSSTNVVWQSSWRRDTLVGGQKLTVGGELRSSDSNYLARMEKGGLVLYLNNGAHFGNNMQPPPYWILPIFGNNRSSAHGNASINELISTAPCSNSPAFAVLDSSISIRLDPGSCNLFNTSFNTFLIQGLAPGDSATSWAFLRLENDGRLYINFYSAMDSAELALDSAPARRYDGSAVDSIWQWGSECSVPKACGPLGVCTPGAKPPCSCPTDSYFERVNITDGFTQGCKRLARLPECTTTTYSGNEHINSTDFTELKSTATIFLFNGWSFNPTLIAPVAHCKSLCSSNCSCHGFFYQVHISACFFISDEFTLLEVVDKNLTRFGDTSQGFYQQEVLARNYITYLKVVSTPTGSDSNSSINRSKSATTALIVIVPTMVACLVVGLACTAYRKTKLRKTKLRLQAEEERELHDILPL